MENKVITLEQLQKALLREEANDTKELEALSQEIKDFISTLEVKQVQPDWKQDNEEGCMLHHVLALLRTSTSSTEP